MNSIESIALAMVQKGKGILAADESNSTMTKRLDSVKIPSTEENRLNFREALFTSKKIKDFLQENQIDVVIAHAGKSMVLAHKALKKIINKKIIGI